jgi:3-oxoacyl-(acyl-carrier-protein) synthase
LSTRVVITGLGVVAPNGTGIKDFETALRNGKSGIEFDPILEKMNFQCKVSGKPSYDNAQLKEILPAGLLVKLENEAIKSACLAGSEAWLDAGLKFTPDDQNPDWDSGIIFGVGALAMDQFIGEKFKTILEQVAPRKLGSRIVEQTMNSGAVTYLNKIIGFGNLATANSSACATGTEAMIMGYDLIKSGKAQRMLCGSTESQGIYIWSGFEALRILSSDSNDEPTKASRPMSANSYSFVPGTGAGALVLEDLESALARGAHIYGEIVGTSIINGGQRNGGSITASNPHATRKAIKQSLIEAGITGDDIDLVSGHLTSTMGDVKEIEAWVDSLERSGNDFPFINAPKAMIGHCLGASGSIEMVAVALQLSKGFVHPNINIDNLHPDIVSLVGPDSILSEQLEKNLDYVIKASLGFGDVNSCIILKKWQE